MPGLLPDKSQKEPPVTNRVEEIIKQFTGAMWGLRHVAIQKIELVSSCNGDLKPRT